MILLVCVQKEKNEEDWCFSSIIMEHEREREENSTTENVIFIIIKLMFHCRKVFHEKKIENFIFLLNELWLNKFERIKNSEEISFLNRRNSFKTSFLCHIDLVTPSKTEDSLSSISNENHLHR